jgi:hypothetical protein
MINYDALDKILERLENSDEAPEVTSPEVVEESTADLIATVIPLILMVAAIIASVVASAVGASKRRDFYYEQIRNNKELIDLLHRLTKEVNKDIASRIGKYGKYVVNTEIEGGDIYWNGNSSSKYDANNIIYFIAGKLDCKKLFKDMFPGKEYNDVLYDTSNATAKKVVEYNNVVKQYNSAVSMENKLIASKTGLEKSIYLENMEEMYNTTISDYLPFADPAETEKDVVWLCVLRLVDYTKLSKLPSNIKAQIKSKVDSINLQPSIKEAVDLFLKGEI